MALKEHWKEVLEPDQDGGASDLTVPEELDDQAQFMYIMAKVNAQRIVIDEEKASEAIKTINKDVPRTDRKGGYFTDDRPERLVWVRVRPMYVPFRSRCSR